MSEKKRLRVLRENLHEHPAVRAWSALGITRTEPTQIEVLKEKRRSQIYRLAELGPDSSSVIAKRSVRLKAVVEKTVYERYLPDLSLSSVHYYGALEEEGGEFLWIFLALAEGSKYSALEAEHRNLAARWLASLHTAAARLGNTHNLPDRGPGHYLEHLISARKRVVRGLTNPALSTQDQRVLTDVGRQCDELIARWRDVEGLCADAPLTLIHGDFAPKNMRVHNAKDSASLRVFDWGTAGWGHTAADLVQSTRPSERFWTSPDLEIYRSRIGEAWPSLRKEDLRSFAVAGKIFRAIVCLNGDAKSLETEWIEPAMGNIHLYHGHLEDALSAAPLAGSSSRPKRPPARAPAGAPRTAPEHPALVAWGRVGALPVTPARVTTLTDRRGSSIYCLEGMNAEGATIMAKHAPIDTISLERTVYEQILPHVPISKIRYHGFAEDEDGERGWLFLQRAAAEEYSADKREHRALAARWLAHLHTRAHQFACALPLPERTPHSYLEYLRSSRKTIVQNLANPALSSEDRQVLQRTLAQHDELESKWSLLRNLCESGPEGFIHGDFAPKNIRIGNDSNGKALQVLDWEHAGWGTPAADLVQADGSFERDWASPDLEIYSSIVQESPGRTDKGLIRALANVGRIFRLLVWIDGDAQSLRTQWVEKAISTMRLYQISMAGSIRELS